MFPRELGLTGDGTFQVHIRWKLRMKHQAKLQTAIDAERNAGRLADIADRGIQLAGKDGGHVVA